MYHPDIVNHTKEIKMAKNDKKIKVLTDRIAQLEAEMQAALQKKGKGPAYDMPGTMKKIADLKADRKRLM